VWLRRDGCREGQPHSCFCAEAFSFFCLLIAAKFNFQSDVVFFFGLLVTFGGMWRWRRVAVARVFVLVVRCRIKRLLLYSRVGKNRDTRRGSPAGAGAGRGANHKTASLFTQLSRHGAPMTYTDLLPAGLITSSLHLTRVLPGVKYISY